MDLHDDDVPSEQPRAQRVTWTRTVVLGAIAVVGGVILLVVGLVQHRDVTIPVLAIVGGALIAGFDLASARRRRRDLGGPGV